MKSTNDDLKLKVVEDINELYENEQGQITMYLSITKYMVVSNAESHNATEE
jgi:GMP synthase PP-ATPase subunit